MKENEISVDVYFPNDWLAKDGEKAEANRRANWLYARFLRFSFIGVNDDWSVTVRSIQSFN